jgi:hypothetical protein
MTDEQILARFAEVYGGEVSKWGPNTRAEMIQTYREDGEGMFGNSVRLVRSHLPRLRS